MSLKDCKVKSEYRTLRDDIIQEFYIPLLSEARLYKRAVGYFSSSSLVEISKGIAELSKKGGKIQIVASPYLNEDDIEAINLGYDNREKIIEKALLRELDDCNNTNYYEKERLNLLAHLISEGVLDIKIAFVDNDNGIGMYHEKMGIIEDLEGNRVAFSGSNNETASGMSCNYETIDTFCSWSTQEIANRVLQKEDAFEDIWKDTEPSINVLEFPKIKQEIIDRYKVSKPNYDIDKEEFPLGENILIEDKVPYKFKKSKGARIPEDVLLYSYQKEAISNWEKFNYRGIFDMATGTGKTYTGLAAISTLSENIQDKLAVIIVCPFQHLVEQWVEDIEKFNMNPIIGYSASPQKNWKKLLSKAIRDQKIRPEKNFMCFICTNATFANEYVQKCIDKIKSPILLVVDEAHNFGAKNLSQLLDDRFDYRLALSATLERHGDVEGTNILYDFFGDKCIEYSLERAIQEEKLTPYYYHTVVVYLTEEELIEYRKLSIEIGKCLTKDRYGKFKLNRRGEILAIKRSRIVAGASNKLIELRRVIKPYSDKYNILVYCGATNVIDEAADYTRVDQGDVRQIEAVTNILGNEMGMLVAKFTSQENMQERAVIKHQFETGDRLQALVAIKCLDEGVNIPGISTAFILASTTNPKEYIQRRGRVLRKAPNKEYAVIYDFVTLPRGLDEATILTDEQISGDRTLVKNEITRIKEFGIMAKNPMDAMDLVYEIKDAYHIVECDNESER